MSIASQLLHIESALTPPTRLVAVSKRHPAEAIRQAYDAGHRDFGESYGQELRDKARQLPTDIRWHYIGRVQRNKVKYIAPVAYRVHAIEHVDQAASLGARAPTGIAGLLSVNLGNEPTKTGFSPDTVLDRAAEFLEIPGFELVGLMCIPPATEDADGARPFFEQLGGLAAAGRERGIPLDELSMGMSADWPVANELGSTWVRVGTAVFGPRV